MSQISDLKKGKAKSASPGPSAGGRKRDPALDEQILEAAIEILADVGFDSMTMDAVAAKAKAGKTTVYRRWSSKAELVRDALLWMSKASVDLSQIPDTGSLKGDLLAVTRPYSAKHSERKIRVLAGLGSFYTDHEAEAELVKRGIFGALAEMNLKLMRKAAERGEISKNADMVLACDVIASMTAYRSGTQKKAFDKVFYGDLIDRIILPALKN